MNNTTLRPGQRVKGNTPGRNSKPFEGTFLRVVGAGVTKFAEVQLADDRIIKARPKTLSAA